MLANRMSESTIGGGGGPLNEWNRMRTANTEKPTTAKLGEKLHELTDKTLKTVKTVKTICANS